MTLRAYHGSRNAPFERFSVTRCGSGVVGSHYKLIFLTTSRENAGFYTDDGGHVALWQIDAAEVEEVSGVTVSEALQDGFPLHFDADGEPVIVDALIVRDVLDGDTYSDVIVISDPEVATRVDVVERF